MKEYRFLLTTMRLDIGGAETHIVELAKGLHREGHHVAVASKGGVFEEELKASGIPHYPVPLDNKKPHNVFRAYRTLKNIIKTEKIDLVHAHARIPGFICGMLHKKMGFPFVTTAHGTWSTRYGLRYITNWGQKTVAVSEDVKKYLLQNYKINEADIKVTINGIDTDKFSPDIDCTGLKKEFGLADHHKKVVYISRLDQDRSFIISRLLEAVPALSESIPNLRVLIVGSGSLLAQVREKAAEINKAAGREVLTIAGSRTDINRFTALADLFIGFGRSSLEALAAGRPLILAGNEGYIGILDDSRLQAAVHSNFSGRGQSKASSGILADDIKRVLTDMSDEEKARLGSFGRSLIENNYSVRRMVRDNLDVYLSLLENGHHNSR